MGERRTRGRGGGGTRARRADSAAATRSARTAGAREGRRRHRGASAREKRGRLVLPAFFLSFFFSPSSPLTQVVVLEQDGAAHPGRQRVVVVPHGRAAVGRPEGRVVRGRVGHVLFLRFCVFALSVWFGVNFFFFECWCWGGGWLVGWLLRCGGFSGAGRWSRGRVDASGGGRRARHGRPPSERASERERGAAAAAVARRPKRRGRAGGGRGLPLSSSRLPERGRAWEERRSRACRASSRRATSTSRERREERGPSPASPRSFGEGAQDDKNRVVTADASPSLLTNAAPRVAAHTVARARA